MTTSLWSAEFLGLPPSSAKTCAERLVAQLQNGSCRFRVGGYDTIFSLPEHIQSLPMVVDTTWPVADVQGALRLIKIYHAFGRLIDLEGTEVFFDLERQMGLVDETAVFVYLLSQQPEYAFPHGSSVEVCCS